MAELKNLAGLRFGRLVVRYRGHDIPYGRQFRVSWVCICDCGNEVVVPSNNLIAENTRSCGCLHLDKVTRHGHAKKINGNRQSSTYGTWDSMRQRCHNRKNRNWKNYGGRGLVVCDRWHAFSEFLADMGERPEGKTLDRIDNNEGYNPSNCRWATPSEQMANRRPSVKNSDRDELLEIINGLKRDVESWKQWHKDERLARLYVEQKLIPQEVA